jgi:hypothetical protein
MMKDHILSLFVLLEELDLHTRCVERAEIWKMDTFDAAKSCE